MDFLGRRKELALLQSAHSGEGSAIIPIYGRRRIGKSALILQFLDKVTGLYMVGKQAPAALQMREFLQVAARAVGEPLLAETTVDGWGRAFELILGRWKGPGKLVIALDEFQWMVEQSPELPSILQELWDREWRASNRVVLILCGSYIGFMEREILGHKSPLFGRRTAQIQLKPFGYREAREFHPSFGLTDSARTYFLCGGVPQYLLSFDQKLSFEINLRRQVLSEHGPLFNEPDFLLREELREVHNYYGILTALASGSATSAQIAHRTGIPERSIGYYLGQLIELGYVRKRYPVTGEKAANRHVRFALEDPLLRFWFRFVFPNRSALAQLGAEVSFHQLVEPHLDSYFGQCFELFCREALGVLYQREGVATSFEIGEYWDKATQIDVVGVRGDNWTDLGECKWGTVQSWPKLVTELGEKVGRYPNNRNATICPRLFVRARGAVVTPAGVRVHELEELYQVD